MLVLEKFLRGGLGSLAPLGDVTSCGEIYKRRIHALTDSRRYALVVPFELNPPNTPKKRVSDCGTDLTFSLPFTWAHSASRDIARRAEACATKSYIMDRKHNSQGGKEK